MHTIKVHVVVKVHGVDYDKTFSKVLCLNLFRSCSTYHSYEISQMNIKGAFLNGNLLKDVCMT